MRLVAIYLFKIVFSLMIAFAVVQRSTSRRPKIGRTRDLNPATAYFFSRLAFQWIFRAAKNWYYSSQTSDITIGIAGYCLRYQGMGDIRYFITWILLDIIYYYWIVLWYYWVFIWYYLALLGILVGIIL